jgi:hypothetical protein
MQASINLLIQELRTHGDSSGASKHPDQALLLLSALVVDGVGVPACVRPSSQHVCQFLRAACTVPVPRVSAQHCTALRVWRSL